MPSIRKDHIDTTKPRTSTPPTRESSSINWRIRRWMIWYRVTAPFRAIGKLLSRVFTIYRVAFLLVVIAVALWYFNHLSIGALLPNIVTDLISVALTVFIIDTMYRLRSDAERKKVLIAQLGSKNNTVATGALRELYAHGWLSDGSLHRAFLISCNLDGNSFSGADLRRVTFSFASLRNTKWFEADLQGAFLDHADLTNATLSSHEVGSLFTEADLTGATLTFTNLTGAKVRHEQLSRVRCMWRAKMTDGQKYDGCYNLPNDIDLFLKVARNPHDPQEWADFYGVSLVRYLEGQAWAKTNLKFL